MARLNRLPPRLATVSPSLAPVANPPADRSRFRDATQPWRAWYKTSRWQRLRWKVLTRDLFTCAMCRRIEADTSRLVCDHVMPHQGDERAFWAGPFQALCKGCHDGAKQRMERASAAGRGDR